ncbi:hypothetical protein SCOR_04045 [Sulfidibacter corallicola]|uniref:Streptomycin adenylyltransferase n=1 Tax=Sulfidibacter corallicola TaxID=2818388 RepID=A0A8A4TR76_SULCO|nr:hypothetical protein [Sulfidibacter corallicola]QTD52050.1 hypothetical protein J3U87_06215 [Sulfidibacter corallicola]
MNQPDSLLRRLDDIGRTLSKRTTALCLIGLGSVGLERDRLDRFSDLDFFVIVRPGSKTDYLCDLSWLTDIAPAVFHFANTVDGYKLLYEDGVFCEFAVFEEAELDRIPFAPGRIVWKAEGVQDSLAIPRYLPKKETPPSIEWLLGEALTNLWVGLSRHHRGERCSAMKFIQGHALDRVIDLIECTEAATNAPRDPFNADRRLELRFPALAAHLPAFLQGYDRNRESALAILSFLERRFPIEVGISQALRRLCQADPDA